jgi:hypothetical protein
MLILISSLSYGVELAFSDDPPILRDIINRDNVTALSKLSPEELQAPVTVNEIQLPGLFYAMWKKKYRSAFYMSQHRVNVNQGYTEEGFQNSPYLLALKELNVPLIFSFLQNGADLGMTIEGNRNLYEETLADYKINGKITDRGTLAIEDIDEKIPESSRKTRESLKKILKSDNRGALKKLLKKRPELLTIKLSLMTSEGSTDKYSLIRSAVILGSERCFTLLFKEQRESAYILANIAIEKEQNSILKLIAPHINKSSLKFPLGRAYSQANLSAVQTLLDEVEDPTKISMFNGRSLFDYAYSSRSREIVMATVKAYPSTAEVQKFYRAIYNDDIPELMEALEKNDKEQLILCKGCTPVHLAAFLGRKEILNYLSSVYPYPERDNYPYLSTQPVYLAAIMKNRESFYILADQTDNLELMELTAVMDREPRTLVDHAYENLGSQASLYLYSKGADNTVNLLGSGYYSQDLIMAIAKGDREYAEKIIALNPVYVQCRYTMEKAVEYGQLEIVKMLIDAGYDRSKLTGAIEKAIDCDRLPIYNYLIRLYPEYESTYDLNRAAAKGASAMCSALINRGADVNLFAEKGESTKKIVETESPLLLAVKANSLKCAALLLDKGADPLYHNSDGETALLIAVQKRNAEMTELLLSKSADPMEKILTTKLKPVYKEWQYFKDSAGDTPGPRTFSALDFCSSYRCYLLLRKAGARYAWESDL